MGWSIAGTEETVEGMQQPDFKDWIGAWYGAPNVVLSVAGNTTHKQVMALAEKLLRDGTAVTRRRGAPRPGRPAGEAGDRRVAGDQPGEHRDGTAGAPARTRTATP